MLKALLEDRQKREAELADERRERKEERRKQDEELAKEERRWDKEWGLLRRLVEERGRTVAATGPLPTKPRSCPLMEAPLQYLLSGSSLQPKRYML